MLRSACKYFLFVFATILFVSAGPLKHGVKKRSVDTLNRVFEHIENMENMVNNMNAEQVREKNRIDSIYSLTSALSSKTASGLNRVEQKVGKNFENVSSTLNQILHFWDEHFCMQGFVHNGMSCYLPVEKNMTWANAERYCQRYGAHLVNVQTSEEHWYLEQLLAEKGIRHNNVWTGGKWEVVNNAGPKTWQWQGLGEMNTLDSYTNNIQKTSYPVRLVNGNSDNSGRVEINVPGYGGWGIVCDDGWGMQEANVVCRQLGFEGAISAERVSKYGYGNGQHRMDDLECSGTEISLDRCRHNGWNTHNCENDEAAGVVCRGRTSHETLYPVRLVDGPSANSGRVEIHVPGQGGWGIICDDNWDINDARVVCRQLGFLGAISAEVQSKYGYGNGQHRMDELRCLGTETSIDKCRHNGWNRHDCGNGEAVGVVCQGQSRLAVDIMKDMTPKDTAHSCLTMDKITGYRTYSCGSSLNFICKI